MSNLPALRRPRTGAVLAGVCRAIADRYGIDPTLVRVAAVVLALSGGVGLVLYGLGVLLIPQTDTDEPLIARVLPSATQWPTALWVVIAVVGCLAVGGFLGSILPFGIAPALVMLAVWYFGYHRRRIRGAAVPHGHEAPSAAALQPSDQSSPVVRPPAPVLPDTEFGRAANAWRERVRQIAQVTRGDQARPDRNGPADRSGQTPQFTHLSQVRPAPYPSFEAQRTPYAPSAPATDQPWQAAATTARSRPSRRPTSGALSRIGLIGVALCLIALGTLQIAGIGVPLLLWLAAPLAVLGLTLLLGAFLGRPRGLAPLAIVLIVLTLAVGSVQRVGLTGPAGTEIVHSTSDPAPTSQAVDLGTLRVDLSDLTADRNATYVYRVDVGNLELVPPTNGNVRIHYQVDAGSVSGPDVIESGTDVHGVREIVNDPAAPVVDIHLSVDLGTVSWE